MSGWQHACRQAAGSHHNVAHGRNAGGNGSDSHQRRQCNVEDLEWGRHGVPLKLQCTQDELHKLISIRSASVCGDSTGGLGFKRCETAVWRCPTQMVALYSLFFAQQKAGSACRLCVI